MYDNYFSVSASVDEWIKIWIPYFNLQMQYKLCHIDDTFLKEAYAYSHGIRILHQDPFEMLISYIISQQKSIPQITKTIEQICQKYGKAIVTEYETVYTFPTIDTFKQISLSDLDEFKLGYRNKYVFDAIQQVNNTICLDVLATMKDELLFKTLKQIKGVGDKVASCVCLFGYNRLSFVPKDVWIKRVITEYFNGENKFLDYKECAGLLQQYAYYYIRNMYIKHYRLINTLLK